MASNNDEEARLEPIVPFPSMGSATSPQLPPTLNTQNLSPPRATPQQTSRSDTDVMRGGVNDEPTLVSPTTLRSRSQRAATFRTVEDFDFDAEYNSMPGWQPGRYDA